MTRVRETATASRPASAQQARRVVPQSRVQELQTAVGNHALGSLLQRAHAGGQPLPATGRRALEAAYRTDLGQVRVHTDAAAADAADSLGARAFTLGSDIWFGRDQYRPQHRQGQFLIAHEVAHTIQQRGQVRAPQRSPILGQDADPAEAMADRAAHAAMRGVRVSSVGSSEAVIRRYTITRAEPALEGGETVVYVYLDNGVRYRVRRIQSWIWEEGRPGRPFPPRVSADYDQSDAWVEVSWCTGTRGALRAGADIPAELQNMLGRLITAGTSGGSPTAVLSATTLTPFVDFAVQQSGGISVSGEVHVSVNRTGATGGGGSLTATSGEWSGGISVQTGAGGPTTVMFTLTFTPGARSERFTCPTGDPVKGRFVPSTTYECTHETPTTPTTPPEQPKQTPEQVIVYFDYKNDIIREEDSKTELDRLSALLGRGYQVTAIDGYTSPEGPMPKGPGFEGNIALAKKRAVAAGARIGSLGVDVTKVPHLGHGELYTLTRGSKEIEGTPLAVHAVPAFMASKEEMARLTPAQREQLSAASTPDAQAAIIYPYLRRAVVTLSGTAAGTPPNDAPRRPIDFTKLPVDYADCPPDVLERAKPLFDRAPGRTP